MTVAVRRWRKGLPSEIRFTNVRHGGLTEIGDVGEDDVRAISGHSTFEVTPIYNKANQAKAKRITARRREHDCVVAAGAKKENEADA